ncbi:hypothetical protein K443DRAFT_469013 [Laccaria amethystina LaAM-08-1]|uniref:Uncharacterized protein n=1 Tax=Laccaria amethystina LaAM-08-1 TaxID=1095629 RepID=A0A0C9WVN5_9AGAR|nr:hypothetical protein K443DRAFT_469013 [Laccaria amethystina LaAM-08-1]
MRYVVRNSGQEDSAESRLLLLISNVCGLVVKWVRIFFQSVSVSKLASPAGIWMVQGIKNIHRLTFFPEYKVQRLSTGPERQTKRCPIRSSDATATGLTGACPAIQLPGLVPPVLSMQRILERQGSLEQLGLCNAV